MKRLSIVVLFTLLISFVSAASSESSASSFNSSDWFPSTRNCTVQEVTIMRKLYVGVAAHTACANESTVDKYEVNVSFDCSSLCTPVLQNLEVSLPDCNYLLKDYENSNKKWEAYSSLTHCEEMNSSDPVSVHFHSNSTTTILTPSSASGSAVKDEVSASSNSGSEFVGSSSASSNPRSRIGALVVVVAFLAQL